MITLEHDRPPGQLEVPSTGEIIELLTKQARHLFHAAETLQFECGHPHFDAAHFLVRTIQCGDANWASRVFVIGARLDETKALTTLNLAMANTPTSPGGHYTKAGKQMLSQAYQSTIARDRWPIDTPELAVGALRSGSAIVREILLQHGIDEGVSKLERALEINRSRT